MMELSRCTTFRIGNSIYTENACLSSSSHHTLHTQCYTMHLGVIYPPCKPQQCTVLSSRQRVRRVSGPFRFQGGWGRTDQGCWRGLCPQPDFPQKGPDQQGRSGHGRERVVEDRGQGAWSGRAWKQDADRVKKCAEEAEEGGRRGVKQGEEVGKIRAK